VLKQQQKRAELVLAGVQSHYGMFADAPAMSNDVPRAIRRPRRSSLESSQVHIPRTPGETKAAASVAKPSLRVASSWKVQFAPADADVCDTLHSVLALAFLAGSVFSHTYVMSFISGILRSGVLLAVLWSFEERAADALAQYFTTAYTAVRTVRDADALAATLSASFSTSGIASLCRARTASRVDGAVPLELVSLTSTSTLRAVAALTTFCASTSMRTSNVDLSATSIGG